MVIVTEWDPSQHTKTLRSIFETQNLEEYYSKWKPTWQLRSKKVLDANLLSRSDIQNLVPERKVYPKGIKWIHDMVY